MPFSGSLSAVLWEREAGVSPVFLSLEAAGKEKKVHLRLENGRRSTHPCGPSSFSWSQVAARVIPLAPAARPVAVSRGEPAEGGRHERENAGRGEADQRGRRRDWKKGEGPFLIWLVASGCARTQ